ncbi:MAG: hypothetical protein WC880_01895 [Candidatus Paceibacterota bacterium]
MSAEGYIANEGLAHAGKEHASKVETIPLLRERRNELTTQTLSRRVIDQEQGVYVSFNRNKNASFHNGLEKTAQVATLSGVELLASATAIVGGSVILAGTLYFPLWAYESLAMNLPIFPGILTPAIWSVVALGFVIAGMKRIAAATRRLRSLF